MASNELNKHNAAKVKESIALYQKTMLEDINLVLRIITKNKTYITKLIEWPGERLIFAAPLDKLDWVLFERNRILKVAFITKKAIFSAELEVLNRYQKNDVLFYSGILVSPLFKQQQRQYFRLDVLLPLAFKVLPKDTEDYNVDELPKVHGTAVNISIGGMNMVCEDQLRKGDLLLVSFNFMDTFIETEAEVLFLGEKNNVGTFSHRMRFPNLDNTMKNTLSKLIFEKQRQLMSKPKESLT